MSGIARNLLETVSKFSVCFAHLEIIHNSSQAVRYLGTSSAWSTKSVNSDYVISPVYKNRNPRNLEKLAYARKRVGWQLQSPRRDFYHKLVLQRSRRNTEAWVEHSSGKVILSASTTESAISSQLNSLTDVSACENIGRVLAQRCLESGIEAVFFDESDESAMSERVSSFLQAFKDLNISLTEPEMKVPEYRPGINYDGYNRYAEPKVWKEDYQHV